MPSKSPEQARLMAAAAHDPEIARNAGIKQSVAREFNQADANQQPNYLSNALKRRKEQRNGNRS